MGRGQATISDQFSQVVGERRGLRSQDELVESELVVPDGYDFVVDLSGPQALQCDCVIGNKHVTFNRQSLKRNSEECVFHGPHILKGELCSACGAVFKDEDNRLQMFLKKPLDKSRMCARCYNAMMIAAFRG